jgi:hypothetical protein
MNASTQARLALRTDQKRFPRPLVEGLVAEMDALRKANAELRQTAEPEPEPVSEAPEPVTIRGERHVAHHAGRIGGGHRNPYCRVVPVVYVEKKG